MLQRKRGGIVEIGDGEIMQSLRQRELQKIYWDNRCGGRMEE